MMKKLIICLTVILVGLDVSAQKNKTEYSTNEKNKATFTANKVKSIVEYEQKFDKAFSNSEKESETYFDAKGNIIEEIEYKDGKINIHIKYQYDANNNLISETELNSAGKVSKKTEYKYSGNLRIEKTEYDGNNKMKSKKTYQYQKY